MASIADPARLHVDKVADVLADSSEPHLLTGDEYKESLRDGRRVFDATGTQVDDVTTHPHLRAVNTIGRVMDLQHDEGRGESLTYTADDGARRAVGWQIPSAEEHLWAKYRASRATTMETLGMFGRPPDYGPMMLMGFLATIDRVEEESKENADHIRGFAELCSDLNLLSTDLIVDPQSDRRIPNDKKPGQLRIVKDTEDGIVVRGAKVAGSIGALTHFFTLSTVLGGGAGKDAAIWAAVPVNSEGLSLVMREPTTDPAASKEDHPVDANGEEMDQFIVFDDVFIPREFVFSAGNEDLLDFYFESCSFALWSIMMRLGIRAEIFAGTAQAITEILGTDKIPGVQDKVTEVTLYAQALKAFTAATIVHSVDWCGVQTPEPQLVTAGRLYSIQNYPRITYNIRDLCGQALISRWPEKIWEHPEFGPLLEEYLPGTGYTAREKNQFFNFVWDLLTGGHAGRVALFENVNATPPAYISHLLYEHVDRGPMARYVKEYAGIPPEPHTEPPVS